MKNVELVGVESVLRGLSARAFVRGNVVPHGSGLGTR